MWIRSQDKSRLIKVSGLRVVNGKDFICIKDDSGHILGVYQTEKKALKVLDMITEMVSTNKVFQMPPLVNKIAVKAFRFGFDDMPKWFMNNKNWTMEEINYSYNGYGTSIEDARCKIKTPNGTMIASFGDYIIKNANGEIYPCKPDIFEETYEVAKDE
jgi:hypothetical protein